jgi:AraC-like DNA-binding protein
MIYGAACCVWVRWQSADSSEPEISCGTAIGNRTISGPALAVGFTDASQLNRVFRKLIGVTLAIYRRESGLG